MESAFPTFYQMTRRPAVADLNVDPQPVAGEQRTELGHGDRIRGEGRCRREGTTRMEETLIDREPDGTDWHQSVAIDRPMGCQYHNAPTKPLVLPGSNGSDSKAGGPAKLGTPTAGMEPTGRDAGPITPAGGSDRQSSLFSWRDLSERSASTPGWGWDQGWIECLPRGRREGSSHRTALRSGRQENGRPTRRRKEVALGRLKTYALLMTAGAWGPLATSPSVQAQVAAGGEAAPSASARPAAPVPPIEYLKAGAQLYNASKFDLAAKYLQAAHDYRDQLTPEEREVLQDYLDAYRETTGKSVTTAAASPASKRDVQIRTTSAGSEKSRAMELLGRARRELTLGRPEEAKALAREAMTLNASFAPGEDSPEVVMRDIERAATVPATRGGTTDEKQKGRWLLKTAREQMAMGNLEAAAEKLAEVERMSVKWGLFDDTPAKVRKDLEKMMKRVGSNAAPGGSNTSGRKDLEQARDRLRQARAALDSNDLDKAEEIAREVESWNLKYGVFEDHPLKVMAAVKALRQRDEMRGLGSKATRPTEGIYQTLVEQARERIAQGKLDEAEELARKAKSINAYPPVTADRAESVLYDLALLRAKAEKEGKVAEPMSTRLEREANELLAQGKREEAAAKFAEADRMLAQETGRPQVGEPSLSEEPAPTSKVDAQVVTVTTSEPQEGDQAVENATRTAALALDDPDVPDPVDLKDEPLPQPIEDFADADDSTKTDNAAMEQAQALLKAGNFAAARAKAKEAMSRPELAEAAEDLMAQIGLAEQAAALSLYENALAVMRQGDFPRAKAMLEEVLASQAELDPALHDRIRQMLERIVVPDANGDKNVAEGQTAVTNGSKPVSLEDAETIRVQRLNAEVGEAVAKARRMLEVDPDQSIRILEETLTRVQSEPVSPSASRAMVRRVEVALELARRDKAEFDARMKDANERAAIERKRLRILEAEKAKLEQFGELMTKATEALNNNQYVEAEAFAKKALEIDPNDVTATALIWKAQFERRYKTDEETRSLKEKSFVTAMQELDKAFIVPDDVQTRSISYPETFADLTKKRREAQERMAYRKPESTLAIERKLNEPITINVDKQPLAQAMEFIRNYTGLNVVIDPKALAAEGLTMESPVTLHANDIRLKNALRYMLEPLGLTYRAEEEVLLITSPQSNTARLRTETYYVGDLVLGPNQPRNALDGNTQLASATSDPMLNPVTTNTMAQTPFGQVPASSLNGNAGSANGLPSGTNIVSTPATKVDMTPLIQLITTSIAPGTWKLQSDEYGGLGFGQLGGDAGLGGGLGGDVGGQVGTITPFFLNISLIIRHTDEVHEQVDDLLRQLRRLQDLQISVEVRFITVDDNFFEEIGVDFDFEIQDDVVGRKSSFAILNGTASDLFIDPTGDDVVSPFLINQNRDKAIGKRPLVVGRAAPGDATNPATAFTPNLNIPFVNNTEQAATPTLAGFVPGAGATLGVSILSDLEVYLFMRAAQTDVRSNIIQAPKVTTFNGAFAQVASQTQQFYVASVTPVVAFGAVAFTPNVQPLPIGITLNVQPVITADRRYVRLSLNPVFISNASFQQFTVAGGVGGIGGIGGIGGGDGAQIATTIQLPTFTLFTVNTTVTVPDGGTVLLGGVKTSEEERREFGVPVLSKTPYLNRLFRNIGIGRTSRSIMMMVTPRIIILEEEEERLGIPPTISL